MGPISDLGYVHTQRFVGKIFPRDLSGLAMKIFAGVRPIADLFKARHAINSKISDRKIFSPVLVAILDFDAATWETRGGWR